MAHAWSSLYIPLFLGDLQFVFLTRARIRYKERIRPMSGTNDFR